MAITFDGQNDRITTSSQSLTVPTNVAGTFQAGGLAIGAGSTVLVTNTAGFTGIGSATPGFQLTVDQATTDGNLVDLKNEEVRLLTGVWGTGSTYPREITLNGTRFDSGSLPALRIAGQGGIKFAVDLNTVRMEIDSSGRVTTPYQPCFSVYRTTDQSIAHNALTKVQFNTENFDVGSNFDSSTNFRFTAPVAGKYAFMGVIYIYSVYLAEVSIYKNGSQFKRYSGALGSGGNDNPNGRTYAGVVDLAVNDYVEIYAFMTRTGDSATQSIYGGSLRETSFDGFLIG